MQTRGGHPLVRLSVSVALSKKGAGPPLIWRSLIIPCRTGGPLIQPTTQPPLTLGLTRQAVAHCPPPLSPIVLSSFSGCNCSTINSGGKENAVCACIEAELRGRKEDGDKRNCKRSPCAISLLLYCCIVSRIKSTSVAADREARPQLRNSLAQEVRQKLKSLKPLCDVKYNDFFFAAPQCPVFAVVRQPGAGHFLEVGC